MTFPAQIGMHVAVALVLCGVVWLGVVVVEMLFKTRPQGGGKSAGYARAGAEAEGRAGSEAADNGPGGRPAALSGTTKDPIDEHIDTAAAVLQPDAGFKGWADDVDAWVAAGCPAVWPIPVVPGQTEREDTNR